MTAPTHTPLSSAQWVAQLQKMLGAELKVEASSIDPAVAFTQHGLDSIAALSIAGDIEDICGLELPSTLLWDYQTINELAQYLSQPAAVAA